MPSMDHLDNVLLATHPDWCEAFLDDQDKAAFLAARRGAPDALFVGSEESVRWSECRDHIERLSVIAIDRNQTTQPLSPGPRLEEFLQTHSSGAASLVEHVLRALAAIRQLRGDPTQASDSQRVILEQFAEFHRQYNLAA